MPKTVRTTPTTAVFTAVTAATLLALAAPLVVADGIGWNTTPVADGIGRDAAPAAAAPAPTLTSGIGWD